MAKTPMQTKKIITPKLSTGTKKGLTPDKAKRQK